MALQIWWWFVKCFLMATLWLYQFLLLIKLSQQDGSKYKIKIAVLLDVILCSLYEYINIVEEPAVSIIF